MENPYMWKMMKKYHDVISVNYYQSWGPDAAIYLFEDWEKWGGKPVMLTEWYSKAMDVPDMKNTRGAGWLVKTQEDRAKYYEHFILGCAEIPNIVGAHYYEYLDPPYRSENRPGANKGISSSKGVPYKPIWDSATRVNHEIYPLIDFFLQRR